SCTALYRAVPGGKRASVEIIFDFREVTPTRPRSAPPSGRSSTKARTTRPATRTGRRPARQFGPHPRGRRGGRAVRDDRPAGAGDALARPVRCDAARPGTRVPLIPRVRRLPGGGGPFPSAPVGVLARLDAFGLPRHLRIVRRIRRVAEAVVALVAVGELKQALQ